MTYREMIKDMWVGIYRDYIKQRTKPALTQEQLAKIEKCRKYKKKLTF